MEGKDTKRNAPKGQTKPCEDDGIYCPIISCVFTINAPSHSGTCCQICGGCGNSAPTIVCNQSIIHRSGNQSNIGCLCYPLPNRLLAFEGSLLHGVVPGIPFMSPHSSSSDESDRSSSDDEYYDYDFDEQKSKEKEVCCNDDQRITLMMGFWEEVSLTVPEKSGEGALSVEKMGPNVPFDSVAEKNTWTDEFDPISLGENDIVDIETKRVHSNVSNEVPIIDPLWVPIRKGSTESDDNTFGEYTSCIKASPLHGRFFLKSLQTTDIDQEVLAGT